MRVGVDTGGTFTDCVIADGRGIRIVKVFSGSPSVPEEASRAIIEGVRRLIGDFGNSPVEIVHGTTVSTNTLLERRGARVALITTHGFEDLIEIGRQARPRLYDLNVHRDPPLVSRRMRWGLQERTTADGRILTRPTRRELQRLREMVRRSGAESVAVCLLFSFRNPTNERLVLRTLRKLGIPLSISHQILPEFREYERLSTTTINAYLMPRVSLYLRQLALEAASALSKSKKSPVGEGGRVRVFVMESSGGITTARQAAREPVRTIFSGPAGGVAAAAKLAEQMGIRQAISFDMGGTSTDVCLFEGRARITNETTVGGLPVAVPVIDVHSVGAGGGSVARFDAGGALRVGPESAGARPGPVCYGRGGRQPTVTDANLILGRLDPDHFLGGTFRLDSKAAEDAFAQFIRQPWTKSLGRNLFGSPLELACGIIAVANANMERALRVISVERGHDPRDFTLIAFGGAGGLHAAELGRALSVARIIVPQNPGAFSALGILLSDAVKDVSQSVLMPVPEAAPSTRSSLFQRFLNDIARRFRLIERMARAGIRRDHFPPGKVLVEKQLDVRYSGQAYELTVPFSSQFPARFEQLHEKTYGYAHSGKPLEVVNLRLRLTVPATMNLHPQRSVDGRVRHVDNALIKERNVWFENRFHRTPVYAREHLSAGSQLLGPSVIVECSSTTLIPPGFKCRVDKNLSLVLTYNAG